MHYLFYLLFKKGELRTDTCKFFEDYVFEIPHAAIQSYNQ